MAFQRVDTIPTARGIDVDQFREGVELAGDPANEGQSFKWDEPVRSKSIKAKLVEHFGLGEFNEAGLRVEIGFKPIKEQVEETYQVAEVTRPATEDEIANGQAFTGPTGAAIVVETPESTATRIVEKETSFEMYFFGTREPKPERKPRAPKDAASTGTTATKGRGRAAAKA